MSFFVKGRAFEQIGIGFSVATGHDCDNWSMQNCVEESNFVFILLITLHTIVSAWSES